MGTRILSVEDDERIRTAVKLALEDEGWEVEEADNGEDALDSFTQHPADVVLIDIMLPGIDGFEVCRSIRRASDVPIVMVTARADTHDVVAGLEAGADDYLTKPFAPKELSARIRALLRRARTANPAIAHLKFGDLEIGLSRANGMGAVSEPVPRAKAPVVAAAAPPAPKPSAAIGTGSEPVPRARPRSGRRWWGRSIARRRRARRRSWKSAARSSPTRSSASSR